MLPRAERLAGLVIALLLAVSAPNPARADDGASDALRLAAAEGLKRAVTFFHKQVAIEGGYLWRYSADLSLREGEGVAGTGTIWVQPPGTPAVGAAMLAAWERTRDSYLLDAATDAGRALVHGQLHSGGWTERIELDPGERRRFAYRVDGRPARKARNVSSLDDDKTQSALRLLVRLDRAHDFKDASFHEAALFALESLIGAQYANGAWPQGWDAPAPRDVGDSDPQLRASFPTELPKTFPGKSDYWRVYTFNDNAMGDTVAVLLEAADVYGDDRYRDAALRCGDFILRAQLPEPQPGWAQQYNEGLGPAWARRFEPPAVSSRETQGVIRTLMLLYRTTGDERYLESIPPALKWLKRSALPDGRLARFYELRTNRPLYFTSDYALVYNDLDLPTHYAFKVDSDVSSLWREYNRLLRERPEHVAPDPKPHPPAAQRVLAVMKALDDRGAWVENGRLKYHKVDGPIIDCATFVRNVDVLSRYLAAVESND